MRTFKDSAGRSWTISITVDAIKRVMGSVGVNLSELHGGDPPLIVRLEADAVLLFDVIYQLIAPQASAVGVTPEQFAVSIDTQSVGPAATAFWEELADFFQSLRPAIRQMIDDIRGLTAASQPVSGDSSTNLPASPASIPPA